MTRARAFRLARWLVDNLLAGVGAALIWKGIELLFVQDDPSVGKIIVGAVLFLTGGSIVKRYW